MLILYNKLNLLHKLKSKPHPQRPERIEQIIQHLKASSFQKFIFQTSQLFQGAQIEEKDLAKIVQKQIIQVHGRNYFEFVEGMWCEGLSKPQMFINIDTYYMKQTFKSAFQAVKTALLSVIESQNKRNQYKNCVCLIRPPGHHSGMKNQPHGFSFFNNAAIAANYFVRQTKKKTVIIDWDIHHGQGTQKIFYNRSDVLYISLHRFDNKTFFPHVKESGTQYFGQKQGKGFNINICWNFPKKQKGEVRSDKEVVRDKQYIYCFQQIILPILRQYQFQAIFISCGFDCAEGDPIGQSKITKKGFKQMTKMLKAFEKKIFVFLEGGYNIDTLKWGIQGVLQGLMSEQTISEEQHKKVQKQIKQQQQQTQIQKPIEFQQLNEFARKDIQTALIQIKKYWKV